jgi:hypothetical protein
MKALGLVAVIALAASGAAQAQDKVYRCGPGGNQYSSTPCPDGKSVDVADPRSATQQDAARAAAARDAQLGNQLARQRRERERAALNQKAATLGPVSGKAADKQGLAAKAQPKKRKPHKQRKAAPGDDPALSPSYRSPAQTPSK